jgi:hypothetical protein
LRRLRLTCKEPRSRVPCPGTTLAVVRAPADR